MGHTTTMSNLNVLFFLGKFNFRGKISFVYKRKQLINNYRVIFSAVIGGKKAEGSPERSKLAARALLASTPGCACRAPALSFRVAEVLAAAIRWPACVTCSRTISCCAEHSRHFLRFVYWLFYDFLEKHACLPAIKTNISSVL